MTRLQVYRKIICVILKSGQDRTYDEQSKIYEQYG